MIQGMERERLLGLGGRVQEAENEDKSKLEPETKTIINFLLGE